MKGRPKKHPIDQVRRRMVTMYLQDWALVDDIARTMPGMRNRSSALRFIIREWAFLRTAVKAARPEEKTNDPTA